MMKKALVTTMKPITLPIPMRKTTTTAAAATMATKTTRGTTKATRTVPTTTALTTATTTTTTTATKCSKLTPGHLFTIRLIVLLMILCLQGVQAYNKSLHVSIEAETRLLRTLLQEYDPRVRPVQKPDDTIQVSYGVVFRSLLFLDEKKEIMESLLYVLSSWHDGRLTWDINDYSGIDSIKIPANNIWLPDFLPLTTVDEVVRLMETQVIVFASGHVTWIPTLYLRSPCAVNLRSFPFDEQRCTILFASYVYHANHLNMTYWGGKPDLAVDSTDYIPNTNWQLAGHSVEIEVKRFPCCPEPYQHMKVIFAFKRNAKFYVYTFIVPAILLGLLAPVSLLLPPESKERISLGSVVTLSIVFINTNLSDALPAAHNDVPAISIYYTLILLWSVTSVMCSVFILNLHHRGPRRGKVPDSLRWIFLRSLRRLVCLGSENYYPLSDSEAISMRGLQPHANSGGQEARNNSATKMERDMEDVSLQLNHLSKRFAKREIRQDVLDEWHQLALVMDRTLFLLFLLIFLMCTVVLLA